jgi:hypothetical protein
MVEQPRAGYPDDNRSAPPHDQFAFGDLFSGPSRVYGNDSVFAPRPEDVALFAFGRRRDAKAKQPLCNYRFGRLPSFH